MLSEQSQAVIWHNKGACKKVSDPKICLQSNLPFQLSDKVYLFSPVNEQRLILVTEMEKCAFPLSLVYFLCPVQLFDN